MMKFMLTGLVVFFHLSSAKATTFNCSSTAEIISALAMVQAGDEIVIAPGTYVSSTVKSAANYYSSNDGTEAKPILIRSASATDRAHLQGSNIASSTVLRIEGDYWIVKDLEISNGLKGLVFDNSNYSQAINCKIHGTGNEALHIRDGSDHVTIDQCHIYDAGNVNPGYGEGIYIGTDKGSWTTYDPYVDFTTVKNCTLGPDIAAEAFDIKEGTQETTIEYNTIDGTGISGENSADSFIDLKGIRAAVRFNTFNRNNESQILKGIAILDRGVELSGYEHAIHNNTFNMDVASGNAVDASSGTSGVHAWNNTRTPEGSLYNSRVIETCPSWYPVCDGNTPPVIAIVSPKSGETFTSDTAITISAEASDPDGSIQYVDFYQAGLLIGRDDTSPYSVSWEHLQQGIYNLVAIATDNQDKTSSSILVTVEIIETPLGILDLDSKAKDSNLTEQNITMYPNPVSDYLIIKNTGDLPFIEVDIFNVLGQKIYHGEKPKTDTDFAIDASSFDKGYYLVVVNSLEKQVVKRIIKN